MTRLHLPSLCADPAVNPLLHIAQIADLRQGIATFYDESSMLWESMWGEHMHHGAHLSPVRVLHCVLCAVL